MPWFEKTAASMTRKGAFPMYFKQADIFWGINKAFVKAVMKNAVQESHQAGIRLFAEGEAAIHFYILLKGKVKLSIGETGKVVYIVSHAGEAFGWSSLIERDVYSASADCKAQTKLMKLDKETIQKALDDDPASGLLFFRRIAETLGNRLLQSYTMISSVHTAEAVPSYGTGQVQDLGADI
jgi:CRP-like cAMP-binding protein